jgi:hypothetical protein
MALTAATSEGSSDIVSWFEQLGAMTTGTIQDSWDHNAGARNANIEMINRLILLGSAFTDLTNSRNAMTVSDMSGANRSGRYQDPDIEETRPVAGICDVRQGLVWDGEANACVQKINLEAGLQLTPD